MTPCLSFSAQRAATLLAVLSLLACKTESPDAPLPQPRQIQPEGTSLFLTLQSVTGQALAQARVFLPSGQELQANKAGQVLLEKLQPGPQLLRVEAECCAPTWRHTDAKEGVQAGLRLTLPSLEQPILFDASQDTTLPLGEHLEVSIPAHSLSNDQGQTIQGQVKAYLSALDLDGGALVAAPGQLQGVPRSETTAVNLEVLGVVRLVFEQEGNIVPYARRVTVRGLVPSAIRLRSLARPTPLPRVPVWRLDPVLGQWTETDDAPGIIRARPNLQHEAKLVVEATVNVTSPSTLMFAAPYGWDLEQPLNPPWRETACVEVLVEDTQGHVVTGREVLADGVTYEGLSRALTDASGRARLEVMRAQDVLLTAGVKGGITVNVNDAGDCRGNGSPPRPVRLTVPVPTCTPGASRFDCLYNAPLTTQDQGACRAGSRYCEPDGTEWSSACWGEVLPEPQERCNNAVDDNCDGKTNEQCPHVCEEGETTPCYNGPASTQNIGLCRGGTKTCVAGGTTWGTCMGEVTPQPREVCTTAQDENCDGHGAVPCQWAMRAAMDSERYGHTATVLKNGKVLVTGGFGTSGLLNTAELYDPDAKIWKPLPTMTSARADHTATLLLNGKVLVIGGGDGINRLKTAEVYDPDTQQWTPVTAEMSQARAEHTATLLPNGKVLVTGGGLNGSSRLKTAEVYDPAPPQWGSVPDMTWERADHTATLLEDGTVLVTGGFGTSGLALDTSEVYNLDNTWASTGDMTDTRADHTATLLADGKVLVTGGFTGSASLATAELYDPNASPGNRWLPTDAMPVPPIDEHTAVRLESGQVLITGGDTNDGAKPFSLLYDPDASATAKWTNLPNMSEARTTHAAVRLPGNQVLVIGGRSVSTPFKTTEVYRP